MKSNLCIWNAETFLLRIEFVFVLVEFWKAHRRTEIMTDNPNFDFGAIYMYRYNCDIGELLLESSYDFKWSNEHKTQELCRLYKPNSL